MKIPTKLIGEIIEIAIKKKADIDIRPERKQISFFDKKYVYDFRYNSVHQLEMMKQQLLEL